MDRILLQAQLCGVMVDLGLVKLSYRVYSLLRLSINAPLTFHSSLVVDKLFSEKLVKDVGIAFLYFDASLKYSLANVAGCLLKQLCQSCGSIPCSVEDLYKATLGGNQVSLKESIKVINFLDFKEIFIVLDALDEFSEDVESLLDMIHNLSDRSCYKIFLTSRPWIQFQDFFSLFQPSYYGYPLLKLLYLHKLFARLTLCEKETVN
jgi:hypothetical protein